MLTPNKCIISKRSVTSSCNITYINLNCDKEVGNETLSSCSHEQWIGNFVWPPWIDLQCDYNSAQTIYQHQTFWANWLKTIWICNKFGNIYFGLELVPKLQSWRQIVKETVKDTIIGVIQVTGAGGSTAFSWI